MSHDQTKELQRKAHQVRRIHEDMNEAYEQERRSRAELLESVVNAARPAAQALSARITDQDVFDERGVIIGRKRSGKPAFGGRIVWLVMIDSGELRIMVEDVAEDSLELHETDYREASEMFDPVDVADTLSELLRQQMSGKASKRTRQAQQTAAKLRAVVTLLNGGDKAQKR